LKNVVELLLSHIHLLNKPMSSTKLHVVLLSRCPRHTNIYDHMETVASNRFLQRIDKDRYPLISKVYNVAKQRNEGSIEFKLPG